jgi:hypothetical protein
MILRKAQTNDFDRIVDLLAAESEHLELPKARDAIATQIKRDTEADSDHRGWIVLETSETFGVAHLAIIPPPPIYDLKGGLAGIILGCWASAPPAELVPTLENHLRSHNVAVSVISCHERDPALGAALNSNGFRATTDYMLKSSLAASTTSGTRLANEDDIPSLVSFNRETRARLVEANPAFWQSHPDAEQRFAFWMKASLMMGDRSIFIFPDGLSPTGFLIAQPASPIQIPFTCDDTQIGIVDDFHCPSFGASLTNSGNPESGITLLFTAETEFVRRGKQAALAICPTAWTSKAKLLKDAGYRTNHTWFTKRA